MSSRWGKYHVFTRTWWKWAYRISCGRQEKYLVPGMGRKYTLGYTNDYEEAVAMCEQYNSTHKPGPLSRKAEFQSDD